MLASHACQFHVSPCALIFSGYSPLFHLCVDPHVGLCTWGLPTFSLHSGNIPSCWTSSARRCSKSHIYTIALVFGTAAIPRRMNWHNLRAVHSDMTPRRPLVITWDGFRISEPCRGFRTAHSPTISPAGHLLWPCQYSTLLRSRVPNMATVPFTSNMHRNDIGKYPLSQAEGSKILTGAYSM